MRSCGVKPGQRSARVGASNAGGVGSKGTRSLAGGSIERREGGSIAIAGVSSSGSIGLAGGRASFAGLSIVGGGSIGLAGGSVGFACGGSIGLGFAGRRFSIGGSSGSPIIVMVIGR